MTDLTVEPFVVPDPATTNWVPVGPGAPIAAGVSSVRVYRSTAQSIPSAAWTVISFDTVRWDRGGQWSAGQPTRLTCKVAGSYLVYAHVAWEQRAGALNRMVTIWQNGSQIRAIGGPSSVLIDGGGFPATEVATVLDLVPGDYVLCNAYQDSGSPLNTQVASVDSAYICDFGMTLIGGPKGDPGPPGNAPNYGTTLPASPVDGQEAILVDSVTNPSYQWRFRYNAGSTSPYKWEFVGGPPAEAGFQGTDASFAVGASTDTAIPSFTSGVTIPRNGVYSIRFGSYVQNRTATGALDVYLNAYVGALNSGYVGRADVTTTGQYGGASIISLTPAFTLTAAQVVRLSIFCGGAINAQTQNPWIQVVPLRVS